MKNLIYLDVSPLKSAYKVKQTDIFYTLLVLNNAIIKQDNEFVENNKCYVYAFNFALLRRFQNLYPRIKRKDIKKFIGDNEKFLTKVNEFTHEIKQ